VTRYDDDTAIITKQTVLFSCSLKAEKVHVVEVVVPFSFNVQEHMREK
jgi:hypothetical protein